MIIWFQELESLSLKCLIILSIDYLKNNANEK